MASGSGWNLCVWLQEVGVGGIYGCGCKEVYRFPHISLYPYYSCICSFWQQHPYFLFIKKKVFSSFIYYNSCVTVDSF